MLKDLYSCAVRAASWLFCGYGCIAVVIAWLLVSAGHLPLFR